MESVAAQLRAFAEEREWGQFHTPKNLAIAIATEAGELLAEFQWLTPDQSVHLSPEQRERIRLEAADVAMHLVRLCDVLGLDLQQAIQDKLKLNAKRYPVALAKGNARKYTEL